jgi:hypothetical protein
MAVFQIIFLVSVLSGNAHAQTEKGTGTSQAKCEAHLLLPNVESREVQILLSNPNLVRQMYEAIESTGQGGGRNVPDGLRISFENTLARAGISKQPELPQRRTDGWAIREFVRNGNNEPVVTRFAQSWKAVQLALLDDQNGRISKARIEATIKALEELKKGRPQVPPPVAGAPSSSEKSSHQPKEASTPVPSPAEVAKTPAPKLTPMRDGSQRALSIRDLILKMTGSTNLELAFEIAIEKATDKKTLPAALIKLKNLGFYPNENALLNNGMDAAEIKVEKAWELLAGLLNVDPNKLNEVIEKCSKHSVSEAAVTVEPAKPKSSAPAPETTVAKTRKAPTPTTPTPTTPTPTTPTPTTPTPTTPTPVVLVYAWPATAYPANEASTPIIPDNLIHDVITVLSQNIRLGRMSSPEGLRRAFIDMISILCSREAKPELLGKLEAVKFSRNEYASLSKRTPLPISVKRFSAGWRILRETLGEDGLQPITLESFKETVRLYHRRTNKNVPRFIQTAPTDEPPKINLTVSLGAIEQFRSLRIPEEEFQLMLRNWSELVINNGANWSLLFRKPDKNNRHTVYVEIRKNDIIGVRAATPEEEKAFFKMAAEKMNLKLKMIENVIVRNSEQKVWQMQLYISPEVAAKIQLKHNVMIEEVPKILQSFVSKSIDEINDNQIKLQMVGEIDGTPAEYTVILEETGLPDTLNLVTIFK